MKFKSIATCSVVTVLAAMAMLSNGQRDGRTARAGSYGVEPNLLSLVSAGQQCPMKYFQSIDFGSQMTGMIFTCDTSAAYLQFATSLFNPKEYSVQRSASITSIDAGGKGGSITPFPVLVPTPFTIAPNNPYFSNKGLEGNIPARRNSGQISPMAACDEFRGFFEGTNEAIVQIPGATAIGPVDPIGHIYCALKTRTKSNNANDRVGSWSGDCVGSAGISISLDNGDGQGPFVFTPTALSQLKLTKNLSVGRVAKIDSYTWKRILPNGDVENTPVEYNMLALDAGSKDAAKMSIRFKPEQSVRMTVRYPNLCDLTCVCKYSVTHSGPIPTFPVMFKIENPENCSINPPTKG